MTGPKGPKKKNAINVLYDALRNFALNKEGQPLAMFGVVVGLVGALAATRLMAGMLFEVSATDPWTFVAVSMLLVLVGLVASYLPARRASRVNPIDALKAE